MPTIKDQLNKLTITATSSDGAIQVKLSRAVGVKVVLDTSVRESYIEPHLAEQIESTIQDAFDGYNTGFEAISIELYGQGSDGAATARQTAFDNAVHGIHLRAVSPRRFVKVDWRGEDGIVMVIQDGILRRIDLQSLEAEINTPLSALVTMRTRRIRALHRKIFQAKHFSPERKDSRERTSGGKPVRPLGGWL